MTSEPTPQAEEANAYAIAYRLLGDRPAARAAATIAVERGRGRPDPTDHWLARIAVDTVAVATGVAAEGRRPPAPDDGGPIDVEEGLRTAIRRRLASATEPEQAAAALHHLAGYDLDDVAEAMGRPRAEVAILAAALAPPPGVSYRLLGDPEMLGTPAGAAGRLPPRRWRPAVRGTTVALTAAVVALVVVATVTVGARPSLGPVEPDIGTVQVGADIRPGASAGCGPGADAPGTTRPEITSDGVARAFRLTVPGPDAPPTAVVPTTVPATVPVTGPSSTGPSSTGAGSPGAARAVPRGLIIALPGYGQSADDFAAASGLEARAAAQGYLVATIDPVPPGRELNVVQDQGRDDDTLHTLAVVDDVLARHCVDVRRVHAVGFGPGGQLAGALACIRPEAFASVTSVSGAFLPEPCRLDPPVSLLEVRNADDDVLPPAGGYGPGMARLTPTDPTGVAVARPPAAPADDVVRRWGDLLGAGAPSREVLPDGTVTVARDGGAGGSSVRSVLFTSGGHAWPAGATGLVLGFIGDRARA